eukprot:CAMPEP_0173179030 /NCGR_PEP_ID=MMETSP1141-20130122/5880_1 /TAXON_ID=483371 /ORGANISM="non described non described, Strain CCMP2298" /LENGTH=72 /DNA_ID=CAMNT_0014101617 /DNA_START=164 /DNA_END=382 /DNA_ORIENTATION=+
MGMGSDIGGSGGSGDDESGQQLGCAHRPGQSQVPVPRVEVHVPQARPTHHWQIVRRLRSPAGPQQGGGGRVM